MKFVHSSVLILVLLASASQVHGQVAILAGSISSGTTNTFSYTPPAGYNRLVVLAVSRRYSAGVSTVSTIDYGTAGTGSFTAASVQTSSTTLRTELWYLPESEIRDGGYCGATITINWVSNTNSQSQTYTIMTLSNVDQTAINAVANNATANAQFVQCALTAQQAVDMVVYASASVAVENHTPNSGTYTEQVEVAGTTHTLALATKLNASAAETPRANWPAPSNQIGIVAFVVNGLAAPTTGTTFYSLGNGNWDDNTTWSFTENGSGGAVATGIWPRRTDNVVIKGLHTVTINAVDDNKTCGISANSLNIANVGAPNGVGTPFDNSASSTFYQSGNIGVTGTLYQSNGGINMMTSGTTTVVASGALNVNQDFYNIGYFEVMSGGTFSSLGNFVISGTSTALINNNISIGDDFGIDFTSATICGSGVASMNLGVGSAIVYTNPATPASHAGQLCSAFVVACPGGGCSNFPVTGTGTTLVGNSGPAGVGESSNNRLWLRSTDISQANNTAVSTWTDASGNGLNATQGSAGLRPKFFTNVVNTTIPVVRFDGATFNYLTVGQSALLDFTPRVDVHSYFAAVNIATNAFGTIICRATSANRQWQYTSDQTTLNRFGYFRGGDFSTGSQVSTAAWKIPEAIVGTSAATGFTAFSNGTSDVAATTINTAVAAGTDVLVGARRNNDNTDAAFYLTGDIGEIILYDVQLSTVHRVLIENYLAAKFNLAVATEVYTRDGAGYDFEVAGFGQVAAGGSHKDAKGPGIVRMWNPSGLGDGEYLVWGHDNATLISTTTAAAPISERLLRIWALTMTGDVGTVSISFDLTAFPGTYEASDLRLMIDRDNNFANNSGTDVIVSGGILAGHILTFTAVDFNDGDRFTLGNLSAVNLLPIGLVEFNAVPDRDVVKLNWSTMSEHNNDFFTIERSVDGEQWDNIASVKGAGTSSKKLQYSAVDDSPVNGVSYYRLRQTDFDGKFSYSPVQRIELEGIVRLNVFPNPSQGSFTITGSDDLTMANVQMLDVLGRPVAATVTRQSDSISVDPTGVAAGVYFIRVTTGEWARTVRVVHE